MSELLSLSDIFKDRIFRIPDYQRGYAWQAPQLRDFWEDLVNLQVDRYHYTGLISIKGFDRVESRKLGNECFWLLQSGYKAYHIVDGQQRITTFIILLNEILELVSELPENNSKDADSIFLGFSSIKDIRAKYILRKRPPEFMITSYIFGYENDNPSAEYLKYSILGKNSKGSIKETYYTKNLKAAKDFFSSELKLYYDKFGYPGIEELYQKLTQRLMFNIHEIDDDYDVFVAFETMNNRGKKLTNLELLKNRLIYLTTLFPKTVLDNADAEALREKINTAWGEIYYQLGRDEKILLSDDEFLRAHWIMYYKYSRKKGDDYIRFLLRKFSNKAIFEIVAPEVQDEMEPSDNEDENDAEDNGAVQPNTDEERVYPLKPSDVRDYVESLSEAAVYWFYTFFPDKYSLLSEEEKLLLDRLNRLGSGYFRPLIAVSLFPRLGYTGEERIAFFKAIERFIFINLRIGPFQASYKSSDYSRKTRDLYYGLTLLSELTDDLNKTTDENADEAVRAFVSKMNRRFIDGDGFYSWRELKYFLYEYEFELSRKKKIEKLSWGLLNNVAKDRISIEHILPQTPSKYYWRNHYRQFNQDEIVVLSSSLGNLVPLISSINSSLQNDSFDDKKKRAYIDGCYSEIEVAQAETWDAEHIYDRGMKMLKFMERRWNFNFAGEAQMEELLHIGFVHDGREIPAEIAESEITEAPTTGKSKSKGLLNRIAELNKRWALKKSEKGEIHMDVNRCSTTYVRFTTDNMSKILPDDPNARSGWNVHNFYYYEIINKDSLCMKLVFSSYDIPDDLRAICERIAEFFPSKFRKKDWEWWTVFRSHPEKIGEDFSDEEIFRILDTMYVELMDFESRLVTLMHE